MRLLGEVVAEGAGGGGDGPVLTPPPQPAHRKTSIVAAVRARHLGCLTRPAIIASSASMRIVARSGPTQPQLERNRREPGCAGIDFETTDAEATGVVATLIVAVTGDVPVNWMGVGVAEQFAPVGAPEHASVIVPLNPPWGVKTSE